MTKLKTIILAKVFFLLFAPIFINAQSDFYIGGYIRNSFYETGQVGLQTLLANNDIMVLGFNPYSDGSLFKELPINDGTLGNGVSYASSLAGRNGVLSFNGAAGATMDGQQDLLILPTGGARQFTFATWVYINNQNTFVPNKFIFKKQQGSNEISLRIGADYGTLIFRINNSGTPTSVMAAQNVTGINAEGWYHVALTFNGAQAQQVRLYVNGVEKTTSFESGTTFPNALPFIRNNFILGENFEGSLDETFVNTLSLSQGEINNLYNGNYNFSGWNMTKTVAFWNYDDAANPGKDLRTYVNIINDIKTKIAGKNIKLRMSLSSGAWQTAVFSAVGRNNLSNSINNIIVAQNLDGIDIDLEWPTSNTEAAFNNYSLFVQNLRTVIGSSKMLSLSLHPYYYRVGAAAINVSDFVALQVYGPQTAIWNYNFYVTSAQNAINYGIPKEKLVMGLPFYGASGTGETAYKNIIAANPGISFEQDQAVYNGKTYTINGVSTIYKKAAYVCQENLAGVMSWDLAIDMTDYNSEYSLMNRRSIE